MDSFQFSKRSLEKMPDRPKEDALHSSHPTPTAKARYGARYGIVSLLLLLSLILAACPAPAAPAPAADAEEPAAEATEAPAEEAAAEEPAAEAGADNVTIYGETLPDDALPYSEQILREACSINANQTTFDFTVSV